MGDSEAWERLAEHDHAVLATVHPRRGVDAVPVVYAVDDDHVGIPVDTVKPKASTRLQRERNLEADPRATLLLDYWGPADWSRLWWVRAELRWVEAPSTDLTERLAARLTDRYSQYADRPFARVLALRVVRVPGWGG